ncbi:nucleotide-binding domain containing protein, partial [Nitratireductor sp. GCM10026969]|uniref:nucleotide-binding domain containing protein n=1 Tax=Nitratireductor sp. GCM10026969 TaxID=3252645 RepID=UPI00361FF138
EVAEALARRLAPAPPERRAARVTMPTVWGIGSRDAVTLGQLGVLRHHTIIKAPNGDVPETEPAPMTIAQLVPGPQAVSASQAGHRFAEGIGRLIRNRAPASLFACGGETASAVLARLDVTLLEIVGEILPGVPVSRALDGLPGLDVMTKSGGFGAEDTLQRLADLAETAGRSRPCPAEGPAAIG